MLNFTINLWDMTTRETLEKDFDEQDFSETSWLYEDRETYIDLYNVKKYIFEQMIPKVLKSFLEEVKPYYNWIDKDNIKIWNNEIKQKAKEKFNIDL